MAISGNSTDANTWAENPEVYDPSTNTWTVLSNVNTSQVHEEEYPFSYLVPNGDVFTIGPSEDKSFLLDVPDQTWTQVGGSSGVVNGSSVMYRPGKILYSGGTNTQDSNSPANATSAVIDLNAKTPNWRQTSPMLHARVYHTLTMLPRRDSTRGRRRADLGSDRNHRDHRRRAAERDLEPGHRDVVSCGPDSCHPRLSLDRCIDAGRHRAGWR